MTNINDLEYRYLQGVIDGTIRTGGGFFVPDSSTVPFANVAARNTWADANKEDLIQNLTVVVVTAGATNDFFLWTGDDNPATVDPTDWADITPLVQGNTGPAGPAGADGQDGQDGAGVDFTGIADGTLLLKQGSNVASSSLVEGPTDIVSTKSIQTPDNSVIIGGTTVSNAGFNIAATLPDGEIFFPVAYQLDTDGSGIPRRFNFGASVVTPSVANKSETFSGANVQFMLTNPNSGIANSYILDSANSSDVTDCNIIIRSGSHTNTAPAIFDYKRATGGTGFTLASGENTINLPGIGYFFFQGEELYVTIEAGSGQTIMLRGQTIGGETIPYVQVTGRTGSVDNIWTDATVTEGTNVTITTNADGSKTISATGGGGGTVTDEQIQDVVGGMVTGNTETGITVTYDDTNGKLNFVVEDTPTHTNTQLRYGKNTSAALPVSPLTADDSQVEGQWTVEFPALVIGDYWVFELPTGRTLTSIINPALPGLDQQASWTQDGTNDRLWSVGPAVRTAIATTLQITSSGA